MTVKSKGLTKYVVARDALLPSADPPAEKLVKKSLPNEDPLKTCVRDLLNQGGRSEPECEVWCRDYLSMKADYGSEAAADSACIKEAERLLIQTRQDIMKPKELEQCVRNRVFLFNEGEWTATKNCERDWAMGEQVRGSPVEYPRLEGQLGNVRAVATDGNEPIDMIHRELDAPESFQQLARLRIQLDDRTAELMETLNMLGSDSGCAPRHYTAKEAERKARTELGLPHVDHPMQPDVATVPDVTGKTKEQLIKESVAADTERRPNERRISPHSGVPEMYGKTKEQILKEHAEEDAGDRRSQ